MASMNGASKKTFHQVIHFNASFQVEIFASACYYYGNLKLNSFK